MIFNLFRINLFAVTYAIKALVSEDPTRAFYVNLIELLIKMDLSCLKV